MVRHTNYRKRQVNIVAPQVESDDDKIDDDEEDLKDNDGDQMEEDGDDGDDINNNDGEEMEGDDDEGNQRYILRYDHDVTLLSCCFFIRILPVLVIKILWLHFREG